MTDNIWAIKRISKVNPDIMFYGVTREDIMFFDKDCKSGKDALVTVFVKNGEIESTYNCNSYENPIVGKELLIKVFSKSNAIRIKGAEDKRIEICMGNDGLRVPTRDGIKFVTPATLKYAVLYC